MILTLQDGHILKLNIKSFKAEFWYIKKWQEVFPVYKYARDDETVLGLNNQFGYK